MSSFREQFAVLRWRDFRYLFFGRATSLLGDGINQIALPFAILKLTGSPTAIGSVLAARTIPLIAFVLFGGILADRFPRGRLMVLSDTVCMATQTTLAVLLITGAARLWQALILYLLYGMALAVMRPATTGLIPTTVPTAQIQPANALISLASSASTTLGPIIGGVLVATTAPSTGIAADAVSFGFSAYLLSRMARRRAAWARSAIGAQANLLKQFREGWQAVSSRVWLWTMVLSFALFQFLILGTLFVLGPLIASRYLGGAAAWGALVSAMGVGSVVGGMAMLHWRPPRLLAVANIFLLSVVPAMIMLALPAPFWMLVVGQFMFGAGMTIAGVLWDTALQVHVPVNVLSRVSAFDWLGSTALRPVGLALAGPVASAIGIAPTLIGAAGIMTTVTTILLCLPDIRNLSNAAQEQIVAAPAEPAVARNELDVEG
jgi:MFS family permease